MRKMRSNDNSRKSIHQSLRSVHRVEVNKYEFAKEQLIDEQLEHESDAS